MSKRLCLLPLLDASLPADPRGKLCDVCDDTHLAMTRCSVCAQYLCPMATKVHGRLTTTRGHHVKTLASGRLEELIARGGGAEVLPWLDRWVDGRALRAVGPAAASDDVPRLVAGFRWPREVREKQRVAAWVAGDARVSLDRGE